MRETELIRKRIQRENSLTRAMRAELLRTFGILADIGYSSSMPPEMFRFSNLKSEKEVKKAVTDLVMWLYFNELEYADKVIKDVVTAYGVAMPLKAGDFLNSPYNGTTNRQRLRIYANRLKYEMESWIAAGLALKLSKDALKEAFSMNSNNPYGNKVFQKAAVKGAFSATRLRTKGKSWGVGNCTSAENLLKRLIRHTVADAQRRAVWLAFSKTGVIGFNVRRGSSYPCSLCDSMVGFHPMRYANMPPYHPNCCCYAVPVYGGEERRD